MSSSSSDETPEERLARKQQKKERKRKLEQEAEEREREEQERQAKKQKKEAKKAKKDQEQAAAQEQEQEKKVDDSAAAEAVEAKKRHKKEKKERGDGPSEVSPNDAMDVDTPALTEDAEKAAKKARKAAKRAAREAEVLAAGVTALQEEQDELDAEVAAANKDAMDVDEDAAKAAKKAKKREKKEREAREAAAASSGVPASSSAPAAAASSSSTDAAEPKRWPTPPPGNTTLLLFYEYVRPSWTPSQRQAAENFTRDSLTRHGCTGRLRSAREGFNGTLTGPAEGIRAFCQDLREYDNAGKHFAKTDFKLVDGLRDNQMLRGLKVWHVDELVTYGFGTKGVAPIESGGTHLKPKDWHAKAAEPDTVLIDVRNANENAIGRFQPLNDASRVLDPYMRVSTEFPEWVDENMDKLKNAKQIMMYCTGGIRCERASALLVQKGLETKKVFQLEGGIHRYLEDFPDGGHWIGKNYTFDRRFSHGATAKTPEVVGRCACCESPWDRYQAGKKCFLCRMEVLVCRECERSGKMKTVKLKCHLCGGPKPSYLPADEKINKPRKPKHSGKAEAEY